MYLGPEKKQEQRTKKAPPTLYYYSMVMISALFIIKQPKCDLDWKFVVHCSYIIMTGPQHLDSLLSPPRSRLVLWRLLVMR